jgi:hypothetical protein
MTGLDLIEKERQRQILTEGWTPEHDDEHSQGELALAAACYAAPEAIFVHREEESAFFSGNTGDRGDRRLLPEGYYNAWPWDAEWDKRSRHDRLRQLVIAGALIAAEIERILRQDESKSKEPSR